MNTLLNRHAWTAGVIALFMLITPPAFAGGDDDDALPAPSAAAMTFDVAVIRPVSLVATVAGTGLFIVSLPFSLLGHNVDKAGKRLVAEPAKYTFTRPLGNFDAGAAADDGG